jgi:hypothetical protein
VRSPFDACKPTTTALFCLSLRTIPVQTVILPIPYLDTSAPITASARDPLLPKLLPPDLLHTLSVTADTTTTSANSSFTTTDTTAYSTDQHRLASPLSTTIHAALAAKPTPLQAFCILHCPTPTTLSISRHPGSQSAHLTPSCNPHLATVSCCVVHGHATLTSAARLPAYPAAHLAQ